MTTTNTTRRFEISNINTGIVFGIYEGRDESEALDAYAADAGYTDFNAACEASGTHPEDIACEAIESEPSEAEEVAAAIKGAGSLDDLKRAIERYNVLSRDDKAEADMKVSFDALPTFGESHISEADHEGVFSWDRTRLLVLDGSHVEIRNRDFDYEVGGREICRQSGNLTNPSDPVNPLVERALNTDLSCPDHNDPAIMTRVAALAQKLNIKMSNDPAQAEFFYMSEEEQVFVDDSDGLLILVSRNDVAWEAFED